MLFIWRVPGPDPGDPERRMRVAGWVRLTRAAQGSVLLTENGPQRLHAYPQGLQQAG
jgi:hypothetical protein